jgi:hypothetical protein
VRDSDVETMCKYRISRSVFPYGTRLFSRAFSRAPALCRSLCLATTARARPRSLREDDRPRVS